MDTAVREGLRKEIDDLTPYEITVTEQGVEVILKGESEQQPGTPVEPEIPVEPEGTWVIATVDGVPIPKGFVASPYDGEKTKNDGLVIYELGENETSIPSTETHHTSKTTRNQYVWVPVPKSDFTTKFVRGAYNNTTYSNVLGSNWWEIVLDATNMPLATQDTNYVSAQTLKEVQAMYESVKEYEGFYIARYEAGVDTRRTSNTTLVKGSSVYSMMGKIPYNYMPWGTSISNGANGAVEVARSIYPETNTNYGVVSTLTYGAQWDRILDWWLEIGAKYGESGTITSVTTSRAYGNFIDRSIEVEDLNEGAQYETADSYQPVTTRKASGSSWLLTTGALKAASVNNIWDMAGNLYEWTMEGYSADCYVLRGGGYAWNGKDQGVDVRNYQNTDNAGWIYGFRTALYVKK